MAKRFVNINGKHLYLTLASWNARGLWATNKVKRARKKGRLAQLCRQADVVAIQESHVSKKKGAALRRWCRKHKVVPFRGSARRGRLGILFLVCQSFYDKFLVEHRQIVKKRAQIITVYEKQAGGGKGKALGGICNVYLSAKSAGAREKQLKEAHQELVKEGWCTGEGLYYLIGDFNFTEDEADHWGISQGKFKASGGTSTGSKRDVRCFQQLFRDGLRFEEVH